MNYKLYYWPIPFRGVFIRLLLEDANAEYIEATTDELIEIKSMGIKDQPFPSMAPPFLKDPQKDLFLAQMPTIVMYLAEQLNYLPSEPEKSAICLKLILDANDVLAEITNLNGSYMWEHEKWITFRQQRLKRWIEIYEQTALKTGLKEDNGFLFIRDKISVADITIFALFGTMTKCMPELKPDLKKHGPAIYNLCERIENRPQIKAFLGKQTQLYGNSYCGGQIEKSIRSMLEKDK